jgi:type IV pilus assembly protein PilY1
MRLTVKQLTWLGAGALWTIISGSAALADETELFIGTSNNEQPNILFVLDNSGSMGTLVDTQPTYDPAFAYPDAGCDASRVYFRTGTGSIPACTTSNWFNETALVCQAGLTALASTGLYTAQYAAQYDPTNGGSGRRWEQIDNTKKDYLVECNADNGIHGDGNPVSDKFPRNGVTVASDAWQSTSGGGGFAWNSTRTNTTYTFYDGNWLNWVRSPTRFVTRLEVVQEVTNSLLDQVSGVNVGLMTFSANSQGGYVVNAMGDIATNLNSMKAAVSGLSPGGYTPLSETLYEAAMYYMGRNVDFGTASVAASRNPSNNAQYNSPLDLSCQKNFVVFLTDGEPTLDTAADAKITALSDATGQTFGSLVGATCDAETYPAGFNPSGGQCLDELAEFMHDGDLSALPSVQNVDTYTIGFTVNLPILADTATRGGGQYYTADNTATLSNALTNIVTNILSEETTFTAPTVAVNALNQTRNLDDLYISVFTPSGTAHWPGNLKKYRLRADATIVDANGQPAIDPATGFFSLNSQSYWSAAVDGPDVTLGGAAAMIPAARNVYSYFGTPALAAPANLVAKANTANVTNAVLGTGLPGDPTRDEVIDFINGIDSSDSDGDSDVTELRYAMGDPMSAQPVTVVYGPTNDDARVYFATNDGYLHSIRTTDGVEMWSFLPPQFLDDQIELFEDDSVPQKHYGLDANLKVQIDANNDGTIDADGGERVYLYFGMRRGGDSYYALDVSYPDAPRVMWHADSASVTGIGQSWSTPMPTKMNIGGTVTMVLVVGGGYDPTQDDQTASTDAIGNSVYILDAANGNVLWRASNAAAAGATKRFSTTLGNNGSMDYSIPADINVMDINGDQLADRMYFADMGGQVWRFDVFNGQSPANLITGGVIAQLGSAPLAAPTVQETRRFYYAPDAAIVSHGSLNYVHVGVGSGHRAHPNATANEDRFYALRDYVVTGQKTQAQHNSFTPIRDADLVDVTDTITASVPQGSPGWKFELRLGGWRGEKVLAESRVFNNKVLFNTYTPNAGTGVGCEPSLGLRRQYQVSVFDAAPVTNLDGSANPLVLTASDRFAESNGAPLSTPQFIFISDDPVDANNDGTIDLAEGDTNGDGVVNELDGVCLGDTCVEECSGLICNRGGVNTTPIRTFWLQESIE